MFDVQWMDFDPYPFYYSIDSPVAHVFLFVILVNYEWTRAGAGGGARWAGDGENAQFGLDSAGENEIK